VSERQLVGRLFNGAVDVWEAKGTRARDQVQESETERDLMAARESPVNDTHWQQTRAERAKKPPPDARANLSACLLRCTHTQA
jgi:hypothetical protein